MNGNFDIEKELKKLPDSPGIYIMKDKNDNIIYVGKAVNLKNRVRSYFRKTNKTKRIEKMVSLIDHFEYIIVDNEAEALILECNLIKKNMPKFNVLLKDGKTYPYIKINIKDEYPDVYITRRILKDGNLYFGPYANPGAARETLDFIKSKFKIRQCRRFKYKDRPCLNYHINKCMAPCMNYVSKEYYMEQIEKIVKILEGKTDNLEKTLNEEMAEYAANYQYEKAQVIRDQLIAIDRMKQKQKVSNMSENDIDVIGVYKNEYDICLEVFYIRNSKMLDRDHFFFTGLNDEKEEYIVETFIEQFYQDKINIPSKIMCMYDFESRKFLEEFLTERAEKKVEIKVPKMGEKFKLVEMATNNAKITLENRGNKKKSLCLELKETLGLDRLPRKIESFDISHISASNMVAGMSVMIDCVIKKNLSRRFKITDIYSQDDPRCMQEVVTRRLKHSIDENGNPINDKGFGRLPDMILADGGITQIRAIKKAIAEIEKEIGKELDIYVYGMVKNDKHQTRALIDENRKEIEISDELFKLITNFQNEVHFVAIEYHKYLRDKNMTKSQLDDIKGIGTVKKLELLKEFKDVSNIKKASIEEIANVKGINEELAIRIKERLNEDED